MRDGSSLALLGRRAKTTQELRRGIPIVSRRGYAHDVVESVLGSAPSDDRDKDLR